VRRWVRRGNISPLGGIPPAREPSATLRKKVDLFGVRINEAKCSPGRWEGEAENKKGLPVGQAFDVVSTFRTS
jgi:hypothetical protein